MQSTHGFAAAMRARLVTKKTRTQTSRSPILLVSSWDDFGDLGEDMFGGSTSSKGGAADIAPKDTERKSIFVGNLPFETNSDDLRKLAEERGIPADTIVSSRIATKFNTGKSRGFGYLEFTSESSARENLNALLQNISDNSEGGELRIGSRALKFDLDVGPDGPKKGRRHARTSNEFSLFLGNLDFSVDSLVVEDFIRDRVSEKVTKETNIVVNTQKMRANKKQNAANGGDGDGDDSDDENSSSAWSLDALQALLNTPIRVKIAKDPVSGRSKGFGQAYFISEQIRDFTLQALQMSELNGRELTVARSITGDRDETGGGGGGGRAHSSAGSGGVRTAETEGSKSIFLGNLDFEVTADDVADLVTDILGPRRIMSVRLAADPYTGRAKGYGHMDLKSEEDCDRAVSMLQGMPLRGRPLRVDFAANNNAKANPGGGGGGRGRR
jgi:RNA recognition motif-containing protein